MRARRWYASLKSGGMGCSVLSEKGTSLMVSAWPTPTVPSPVAGLVAAGVVAAGGAVVVSSPPPPPHPAERAPVRISARNSPTLAGKLLTPPTRINVSPAAYRDPPAGPDRICANLARARKRCNEPLNRTKRARSPRLGYHLWTEGAREERGSLHRQGNPYRTRSAGELRRENAGERVRLAGWVHRRRDHGGLIFIDLRDRWGITQVTFDPERHAVFSAAEKLRPEWSISVEGEVVRRPEGNANPELPTGEIEVEADELEVLNASETPPFEIDRDRPVDELLRLKYRYLDLRRERMRDTIVFRHRIVKYMRDYLDERGFVEIETPLLTRSTPEGARDYLVPSRLYPGQFYALPQSPQQFKQLLMVAGFERYFQIARALRDEDQRGDRQPEHTQLDLEMSYTTQEEVLNLVENLYVEIVEKLTDKEILHKPFPRLTYAEALARFGSDKPDSRFGLELADVSELVRASEFKVFCGAVESGGPGREIPVGGPARLPRRGPDGLPAVAATGGARGLAHFH